MIADLNAVLGIAYQHGLYPFESPLGAPGTVDQGEYGDTHYYMIPAEVLPILVPLVGVLPATWITALDMPLRTIIEMGYNRELSPGEPLAAQWFRFSPVRDAITLAIAMATGIDDAVAQKTGDPSNRPLGTTAISGPFGVPEFSFRDWFDAAHPGSSAGSSLSSNVELSATSAAADPPTAPVSARARSAVVDDPISTSGQRGTDAMAPQGVESGGASANATPPTDQSDSDPSAASTTPPQLTRPNAQQQVHPEGGAKLPATVGDTAGGGSRPGDDAPGVAATGTTPSRGVTDAGNSAGQDDSTKAERDGSALGEPVGPRR